MDKTVSMIKVELPMCHCPDVSHRLMAG